MHIGFNALGLKNKTGGVETYIYNVVKAVLNNDSSNNNYFLFIGKNTKDVFEDLKCYPNLKIISYPVNTNDSINRVIVENTLLNLGCINHRINMVHHFCNYIPRIFFAKSVVTVHDLGGFFYHEHYPEYTKMDNYYKYMKKELAYTFNKADKIISISDFTKSEIIKYYKNVQKDKIVVIGESLDTRKNKTLLKNIDIKKLPVTIPYILSVSVIRPHKNMDFLIYVYNELKKKYNIPHQLVIAGGIQLHTDTFTDAINESPYKDEIKYLGYVENDLLSELYKNAACYVFPSLYEGFGIPLLEAMEYSIPIASSDKASLPEVGGNGCKYFDPYSIESAVEVIHDLIVNENKVLIDEQKKRINDWQWDKLAIKFLDLYNGI